MAAANAGIGITRAAFYPSVTLSATGGFQDTGFNLASLPNALWSIGASAVLPLFEGGLRRAELQQSWAQYAQTRDTYRAVVLAAFQQVEDGLTLQASLQSQTGSQLQAVAAANKAQSLTQQLYVGGLITYLDVVVAQETALLAEIAAAQAKTAQLQNTANLILAVGGGFTTQDLPTERGVLPFRAAGRAPLRTGKPHPDGTGQGGERGIEAALRMVAPMGATRRLPAARRLCSFGCQGNGERASPLQRDEGASCPHPSSVRGRPFRLFIVPDSHRKRHRAS